jgi:hypothetical protein
MLKGFLGRDDDDEDVETTVDGEAADVEATEPSAAPVAAEKPAVAETHPPVHEEEA